MKFRTWLTFTLAVSVSFIPTLAEQVNAQLPNRRCVEQRESCIYEEFQQYNQHLNYRTSPQFYQRRLNNAENICSGNTSSTCNQIAPEVEARQENPIMEQLRDRQIQELYNRNPNR